MFKNKMYHISRVICDKRRFAAWWAILFVVHFYCQTQMFDVSLCINYPNTRLHTAVGRSYFQTIFPRLKHRGSSLLWCGDRMTGLANQALSFSVNMFYSSGRVRALVPFVCVWHSSDSSSHMVAGNVLYLEWWSQMWLQATSDFRRL